MGVFVVVFVVVVVRNERGEMELDLVPIGYNGSTRVIAVCA